MPSFFRELFSADHRVRPDPRHPDDTHFYLPEQIGEMQGGVLSRYYKMVHPEGIRNDYDPSDAISLRPMQSSFEDQWNAVRWRNTGWLDPWESGNPLDDAEGRHHPRLTFSSWVLGIRRSEKQGRGSTFAVFHKGSLIGQISLGAVTYGAIRSGIIGYWIDRAQAGHGYIPRAAAVLSDWAFFDPAGPRLHRLEIDMIPENTRSVRVAQKLGFTDEGVRKRYMYVNGRWQDHRIFSLLSDEFPRVSLKPYK